MKATGIVVEYNPLHSGHIYHLQQARKITGCDVLVAVCSGNFVQRGEPAVIDKWARSRAAVDAGVDLVIELPFPCCVQSAAQFGENAVRLLALAKADSIVFGSETNNMEELKEIASMSFNIDNFRENMKQGYSYPASYGYMADSYGPNDILAISYLRALDKYPDITPYSIKRIGEYHDDSTDVIYPSAQAIRKLLKEGQDVSGYTPLADQLKSQPETGWDKLYPYVRNLLLTIPAEELKEIFLMDEGIENHLIKQAQDSSSFDEFINNAVTRRYTRSRIQRTLCHLAVHNTRSFMNDLPQIDRIRPLCYNETGQQYLKTLQKDGLIVVNHFTQNIKPYRDLEYRAAALYGSMFSPARQSKILRQEICGQYPDNNRK